MSVETPSPDNTDPGTSSDSAHLASWPRRFGPFVLLKRLGRGGMGDVCLAKMSSAGRDVAGIEKLCVVKTIRPNFTADREYVQRFIDEAKTVVLLMHRNVCQVFDVGSVAGAYYLAMELVPGRDLRRVQNRAREFSIELPLPIALHIVAEMLEALDYAHRVTDPKTDEPLGVVHRDVSPANVIVSFEGEVKLIDFGLAVSTLKLEQTEPGIVLGKLQYMSPEQARGEAIDRRSDVFATGIVMYELLAGQRYYEGLDVDRIWGIAEKGRHQPAKLASLAPAMRALIERATAPVARDWFASCAVFRQELRDVQQDGRLVSTTAEARAFMQTLFPGEEADERRERARLSSTPVAGVDPPSESVRIAVAPGPESGRARVQPLDAPRGERSSPGARVPQQERQVAKVQEKPPAPPPMFDVDATVPMPYAPGPAPGPTSGDARVLDPDRTEQVPRMHGPSSSASSAPTLEVAAVTLTDGPSRAPPTAQSRTLPAAAAPPAKSRLGVYVIGFVVVAIALATIVTLVLTHRF